MQALLQEYIYIYIGREREREREMRSKFVYSNGQLGMGMSSLSFFVDTLHHSFVFCGDVFEFVFRERRENVQ